MMFKLVLIKQTVSMSVFNLAKHSTDTRWSLGDLLAFSTEL